MPRLHKHIVDRYLARPDAELDLHGLSRRQAGEEFDRFIDEAETKNWKTLRVIVGKGWNSPDGKAVLRDFIEEKTSEYGYSSKTAKMNEGGDGVLIISLY